MGRKKVLVEPLTLSTPGSGMRLCDPRITEATAAVMSLSGAQREEGVSSLSLQVELLKLLPQFLLKLLPQFLL
jgi:hypothetical protein